ncbi:unnamed protein product [Prunus brigantina]
MAIQEMIFHNNTKNHSLITLKIHKLRSCKSDNELLRQDFHYLKELLAQKQRWWWRSNVWTKLEFW